MQTNRPELQLLPDSQAIAAAALVRIERCAQEAVRLRGRFTIALSGGSTPRLLYSLLAERPDLPWAQMELCFGDERLVPPDHPESNAGMVHQVLTSRPFVPAARVHRMRGELAPEVAAEDYERTLRALFGAETQWPRFDLVLLGLGSDGHTASLFPHSSALSERRAWVAANWVEALGKPRLTLTLPVLNAAAHVLFLVAGADKAAMVRELLEGSAAHEIVPARAVQPLAGTLELLADRAAASALARAG